MSETTVLSMIRFGVPMTVTQEGICINHFNEDDSGSIEAGPTISTPEIRQTNCQQRPKGFSLPIIVACTEVIPVILSQSPL